MSNCKTCKFDCFRKRSEIIHKTSSMYKFSPSTFLYLCKEITITLRQILSRIFSFHFEVMVHFFSTFVVATVGVKKFMN